MILAAALGLAAVLLFPVVLRLRFQWDGRDFQGRLSLWGMQLWHLDDAVEDFPQNSPVQPSRTTAGTERTRTEPELRQQETPAADSKPAYKEIPVQSAPSPAEGRIPKWILMLLDPEEGAALVLWARKAFRLWIRVLRFSLPTLDVRAGLGNPYETSRLVSCFTALLPMVSPQGGAWSIDPVWDKAAFSAKGELNISFTLLRLLVALAGPLALFPYWSTFWAWMRSRRSGRLDELSAWRRFLVRLIAREEVRA